MMKTSAKGIALIKHFERLRLTAYLCPAGVWTIGWGHIRNVHQGDHITVEKAVQLLDEDLKDSETFVNRECPGINQNQLDALVDFVFNLGNGNFLESTLLRKVKSNVNDSSIRQEFMKWTKARGVELAGLVRRRKVEADLYFS